MMAYALWVAGILAVVTAAGHVLVGTPEVEGAVANAALARPTELLLAASWHLVSVTLVGSAGALLSAAWRRDRIALRLARTVSMLWVAFGGVFVLVALAYADASMLVEPPSACSFMPPSPWRVTIANASSASAGICSDLPSRTMPSSARPMDR
jgi:hypothetical protein